MSEEPLSYDQANGSEQPPQYEADFALLYTQWKRAIEAAQDADELAVRLSSAKKELESAGKVLKQLKEKSSATYQLIHTKKSTSAKILSAGPRFLARRQLSTPATLAEAERATAQANFRRAQQEEDEQARLVADLNDDVAQMAVKKESLDASAAMAEELWMALSSTDEATRLVPNEQCAEVAGAHQEVDVTDNIFRDASTVSADFSRAQLAASNAHRYFMHVLHCCDNLNTGRKASVLSEGSRGGMVNVLNQYNYVQALAEGRKAQACLDEAFRVLEPHRAMIPITLLGDYDALHDSGVFQISKIYNLLYKGSRHANSIRPLVRTLMEKQETAFAYLTDVAVWIQDTVPKCQVEERQARVRRDAARVKLAVLWKDFSSPSPISA